jgi:hypothetical protein
MISDLGMEVGKDACGGVLYSYSMYYTISMIPHVLKE